MALFSDYSKPSHILWSCIKSFPISLPPPPVLVIKSHKLVPRHYDQDIGDHGGCPHFNLSDFRKGKDIRLDNVHGQQRADSPTKKPTTLSILIIKLSPIAR